MPKRKPPLVKLAVAAVILAGIAVLVLRGVDLRALLDDVLAVIRDAGPLTFFAAMIVLPAFGAPMLAFTVPAGEAFGPQLGLDVVVLIALASIALNLAFGYWVSRYALRPLVSRLLRRYGYSVPRVTPENALGVTLVVRLTPGPPYAMQAWLLGCAEVPFRIYMIVSWLSVLPYAVAGIILGQGIFKGEVKILIAGLGLIVALGVVVHWVRKRYSQREG